ncbi:MAG: hypothetical protein WC856_26615, partial [Methylococcaceae bacterium]
APLLGSHQEFLWAPLPSPTFSLLTGQWLDFHQLADYHASRTTTTRYAWVVLFRPTLGYDKDFRHEKYAQLFGCTIAFFTLSLRIIRIAATAFVRV